MRILALFVFSSLSLYDGKLKFVIERFVLTYFLNRFLSLSIFSISYINNIVVAVILAGFVGLGGLMCVGSGLGGLRCAGLGGLRCIGLGGLRCVQLGGLTCVGVSQLAFAIVTTVAGDSVFSLLVLVGTASTELSFQCIHD